MALENRSVAKNAGFLHKPNVVTVPDASDLSRDHVGSIVPNGSGKQQHYHRIAQLKLSIYSQPGLFIAEHEAHSPSDHFQWRIV